MSSLLVKKFTSAGATFESAREEVLDLEGRPVALATLPPGWDVTKIGGVDSCPHAHVGYVISGCFHVVMSDGTEGDISAGEAFSMPGGHTGWVVGDEPFVMLDWGGEIEEV